ncbi:MAG: prepilin-type N-terminal cleavage/methylation domain-containing protein [Bacillota bacterium]
MPDRCMAGKTYRKEAGFTLIETAVTLMVIGIFSALVTVSYLRYAAHWDLVTAARVLASDIRETRDQAIQGGEGADLWFYKGWGYYERRSSTGQVCEEVYLPKRVMFDSFNGFQEVKGLPAGTPVYKLHFKFTGNPGSTGTVYLKNTVGESRKVVIAVTTGRVRVE